MKNQYLVTKLTFLVAALLPLGAAQAQVPRKFDRIGSFRQDSILTRADRAAQQNQAAAPSMPQAPPQVQYMVIELGGRRANGISQSGQIVGDTEFEPGIKATFWPNSQSPPIDIGSLPGLGSVAAAINPRREIVGEAFNEDSSIERPLFWASPHTAPVELPGLPDSLLSEVYDINPSGKIVGQFFSADLSVERAVFWPNSNAAPVYLTQLSDELPISGAFSINASGNIFGDACGADFVECHAAFWATSSSTPVALASPGG